MRLTGKLTIETHACTPTQHKLNEEEEEPQTKKTKGISKQVLFSVTAKAKGYN